MPSTNAPTQRAPQIADAAEHHDHEAVDDVALAEIGAHIVDLRQRHAGNAGDAGAEAEGEGVDAAVRMPMAAAIGAVLRHRAHFKPKAREPQQPSSATNTASAKQMIHRRL